MSPPIVTLLSDFGTVDGFVGAMKGVILSLAPDAQVVDLTHAIPPQDVRAGAWALREAAPLFPGGTVHLAVVDPGVGTDRRPLALRCSGAWFVGPDNGLLSLAAADASEGFLLENPKLRRDNESATFHGRDIFAPAAAHLAAGNNPLDLGPAISSWERLTWPSPEVSEDQVVGRVIHVDRFGNLITTIRAADLPGERAWRVAWKNEDIGPLRGTFGDVASGKLVAYLGSSDLLEIGLRDGRAAMDGALGSEVKAWVEG